MSVFYFFLFYFQAKSPLILYRFIFLYLYDWYFLFPSRISVVDFILFFSSLASIRLTTKYRARNFARARAPPSFPAPWNRRIYKSRSWKNFPLARAEGKETRRKAWNYLQRLLRDSNRKLPAFVLFRSWPRNRCVLLVVPARRPASSTGEGGRGSRAEGDARSPTHSLQPSSLETTTYITQACLKVLR